MTRPNDHKVQNRTGAMLHPIFTEELSEVTASTPPSSPGDGRLMAQLRHEYAGAGELLGHVPKPSGDKAARAKKTLRHETLIDKMGERLAFERSGARLYEALLAKYDAPPPFGPSGPSRPARSEIEHICREEHEHFQLMVEAIESIGGDPTAITPAADVAATISAGLPKVLLDPRTTFAQCLDAVLVAELADNDGWQLLIELAQAEGLDDLAEQFQEALQHEREHLANIREWIVQTTLVGGAAKAHG